MLQKINRFSLIVSASLLILCCIALLTGWISFLALFPHLLALIGIVVASWTFWLIGRTDQLLAKIGHLISIIGLLTWIFGVYALIPLKSAWMPATACMFAGLAIGVFLRVHPGRNKPFVIAAALLLLLPVSIGLGLGYVVIYDLGVYILAYFSVLALLLSLRKNHQA